ncbi:hypothetical protein GOP47_0005695 [Adiantum capillus-veneris]|uniref:1-phosphatidylinositol-4-phosphate 5-kinase n=1 Tax=Adiantum capillus-veneris TaxID=13818 RepID=A0A9D4ZNS5_ADICA|nr:hypothetical protein GOP47_0005069 [Adiantum capillus-veneris]KAI5080216.1 hypothetical protein GOP47_0005695 [Adiantum capillus-veneris]
MSSTVPHTGHDKDKLLVSIQGRHDQVYPSEEPPLTSSPVSHPVPSDVGHTDNHSNPGPLREIVSPNGETNMESWRQRGQDGHWSYGWANGVQFEGEIDKGLESGKGKFTWPSGATYEGSFQNGCLHGLGTYTAADGSSYTGNWIMNVKHGFGEQHYGNCDSYKGTWSQGNRDGYGTYTWANGNIYTGDWKTGAMSGKGKLTWSNGDSFEGHWADGKEHGHGIYTWVDTGCYVGTWSKGLKDGKGTFYPPGTKLPLHITLLRGSSMNSDGSEAPGSRRHSFAVWRTSSVDPMKVTSRPSQLAAPSGSNTSFLRKAESLPTKAVALDRKRSLEVTFEKYLGLDISFLTGETILEDSESSFEKSVVLPIVEREYAQGVLINEIVKESLLSKGAQRRHKQQHKEIKRAGETIIKGHRSYDLMLDLQLGIRYSVGKFYQCERELEQSDFGHRARIWMRFPREGSQLTPCHRSVDFRWKDYCPYVFRTLREMFKIDAADYMMSICGNDALRELSSPGKSGSIFFLSHDDRFLIKTLRRPELKVLLKMLPSYYNHVCKYENTLVTKFFGLHRIKLAGGHKVRFVVMGNVFCTELRIHRRFDLKGSSLGRSSNKIEIDETTTLKDLDLDFTFHLEPSWREALLKQIEEDCNFLQCQQIMDYSLLLGLHFRAPQYTRMNSKDDDNGGGGLIPIDDGPYPESLVLVAHEPRDSTQGSHIRGSSLRAAIAGDEQVDLLAGTVRLQIQLGVNMPARADRRPLSPTYGQGSNDETSSETYDVVLCVGIIDILQEYNTAKKLEHAYKSLQFDSVSISAVGPYLYSQRFQEFLNKVFPENL